MTERRRFSSLTVVCRYPSCGTERSHPKRLRSTRDGHSSSHPRTSRDCLELTMLTDTPTVSRSGQASRRTRGYKSRSVQSAMAHRTRHLAPFLFQRRPLRSNPLPQHADHPPPLFPPVQRSFKGDPPRVQVHRCDGRCHGHRVACRDGRIRVQLCRHQYRVSRITAVGRE